MSDTRGPRTGGRILVDALRVHGADRLFCVPGESYLDVLDALYDTPQISVIVAKHEGAAANMAEADGKLTGRPGICFVTRGPGATHASIGVHTAYQDSTPMILFIGQVAARRARPRSIPGGRVPRRCSRRWPSGSPRSRSAARIPEYVAARIPSARPRAAPVRSCWRCRKTCWPAVGCVRHAALQRRSRRHPRRRSGRAARRVAEGQSSRCSSSAGLAGLKRACAALARFAEANALPVLASFRRQDLIDNRRPCYAGH